MTRKTGKELAQFCVEFNDSGFAYIPIDSNAATILTENGQPHLNLTNFRPNEDITVPLSLETAIAVGIYNIDTVENIEKTSDCLHNPNLDILAPA